ncbi:chorismate mutase AroQ, gamma subclass [Streptomyces griseocarneus]|nr:chorismate mutase AroQ, gamma subclass [Streptomyces griseocarneus]
MRTSLSPRPGRRRRCDRRPTGHHADGRPGRAVTALARLAAERVLTADQVAAAKWVSGRAVEDPARERKVLAELDARSRELGIDRATTQRIFEAQIEASKLVQHHLHGQWRDNPQEAPATAPDLGRVRDRINGIDAEILAAVREVQALLADPGHRSARDEACATVTEDMQLDVPHRQGLHRALQGLCAAPQSAQRGR